MSHTVKKTGIAIIIAVSLILSAFSANAIPVYAADQIEISNYDELKDFITKINSGELPANTNAKLTANITVPETLGNDWVPLAADQAHAYQGVFDGGGYGINGININRTYPDPYTEGTVVHDNTAFLSFLGPNGTLKNLSVNAYIKDVNDVAGLVSYNEGTVDSCTFSGTIASDIYPHDSIEDSDGETGGIVARNLGVVKNCKTVSGTVIFRGGVNAGGIVGSQSFGGTVVNCVNEAHIDVRETYYQTLGVFIGSAGGIVGLQETFYETDKTDLPLISECVNKGSVESEQNSGGICGITDGGIIQYCVNEGPVDGAVRGRSGGICGLVCSMINAKARIYQCSNQGQINVKTEEVGDYIGGIAGQAQDYFAYDDTEENVPVMVSECRNYGNVNGKNHVGGIFGGIGNGSYDTDEHVYVHSFFNLGSVTGVTAVGGIAGNCAGLVADSINYGPVTALPGDPEECYYCVIGGIAGDCGVTGNVSTSYNLGKIDYSKVKDYDVFAGGVAGNCFYNLPGCYYSIENSGSVVCANGVYPETASAARSLSQMSGANATIYMTELFDGKSSFFRGSTWHTEENVKDSGILYGMPPQMDCLVTKLGEIQGAGVNLQISEDQSFINDASVTSTKTVYEYTGEAIYPKLTVKIGDKTLTEDVDYKIYSTAYNSEIGVAYIWIKGINNYAGTAYFKFRINIAKANIKSVKAGARQATIVMEKNAYAYGGSEFQVQRRVKGTTKWYTSTVYAKNITLTGLNPGKNYEVRVRARAETYDGMEYGAWSAIKETGVIQKAANPMTAKGLTKTVKYATISKQNVTIARKDLISISNPQGTLSYTKTAGNTSISINSKTGAVTVKKGLKKGKHYAKIKVTSAGNTNYKAGSKVVTITVDVK